MEIHKPPVASAGRQPLGMAALATQSPFLVRKGVWIILAILLLLVPALTWTPWTQTVLGQGRVVAFNPVHRPQALVSPIQGRVMKWHAVEGDRVKAGQLLVDLVDNDPGRLERLKEQALLADQRRTLGAGMVAEQKSRLGNVMAERPLLIDQARARRDAAEAGVIRAKQNLQREKANLLREEQNYLRIKRLHDDPKFEQGALVSTNDLEEAQRRFVLSRETVPLAEAEVTVIEKQLAASESDLKAIEERTQAQVASERQALASRESDLRAVEQQYQTITSEVGRQENQRIFAPVNGTIFRILANAEAGGQLVNPGQQLAVLVPDVPAASAASFLDDASVERPSIVAELLIDGNDLPLVRQGDRVILQFEGWAAVQFSAYPEAASGTFEGKVYLVDPTSDSRGYFRVLVEPNRKMPAWPNPEYLRQGVRAQGWMIANRVSLGYEIWRVINGFPVARPLNKKQPASSLGPVKTGS